ncbi:LysR family transcriptional regulator [Paraburkholderia sp. J63]|uniref:LysR family transcriptional regulator n=1 Tax=Paraburkholderia sp. J63 TaxID=2805434 RepID=UPI002ABD40E3|nr:LysR family transcriptional regulator [Paraburkholderia sp. J63]
MLTFKQVEALFWIVELGSFEAAANKLNASQSAISKRIQELESTFDLEVFDRNRRTARLTEKGEELFLYAKELLERRDEIVERVSAKDVLVRRLRVGVTELTALTWLPQLITAIKREYPKVIVEAEVELSSTLRERLAEDSIDIIVVPGTAATEAFVSTPLATVENAWMCVPEMVPRKTSIPLAEISQFPLLTQGNASGTGMAYGRFLQDQGVHVRRMLTSNNLVAQIGLTVSGLGVSYLPVACLRHLITEGVLGVIQTKPPLPPIQYNAVHRSNHPYSLTREVARLAADCCDFGTLLLQPRKRSGDPV